MKNKKYKITTYGCQMNEHDSEKISWILENMGYVEANDIEQSDIIIYNTCAIRENAELKVYGKIGSLKQLKKSKPNVIIAICGCMMQIEEIRNTITTKHRHVDMIFGTHNIHKLPQLIENHFKSGNTIVDVDEDSRELVEHIDSNRKYSYKAYVNIMYGCNNFCTYCVVPFTRGREISRDPENIIKEIEYLAAQGCKEVTLLGQNVNSYGKTLDYDYDFPSLLKNINNIDGIKRIRFMTSHPKDISDELIEAYGKLDKLSNHLHLPVQSGSNKVLKEMNRRYTREEYLLTINKLKKIVPDISITTDIIVGFPGETEEDFLDTLNLVKEVEFDSAYIFLYSIREGTIAAKKSNQIDYKIKHDRFQRLSNVMNEISLKKNKRFINTEMKVLVEEVSKNDPEILTGRTEGFKIVHFKGDESLIGSLVNVKIENVTTFTLMGKMI